MKEIICASQAELDAVAVDFDGRVIIKFGTPYNRAVVNRRFKYPVEAWGNSSVEAWGNSSVEARDNSSVVAWDNSSVEARDNSSVVAWGNSSVVAWGNSSVEARDNSQIVDAARNNNIEISGNARIVYNPSNIDEYIDFYGLDATDTTVKLYKAVHFCGGVYCSDYNYEFIYPIGDVVTPDNGFAESVQIECGAGIHLAYKTWAVGYGAYWPDLAILECECEKSDVLVPLYGDGKVRARKAKVLREVPLEECGLYAEIIAKRRANDE